MSGFNLAKAARATVVAGPAATVDPQDALRRVTAMAEQLSIAKDRVIKATAALSDANEHVATIESEGLPELMRELRLKIIGLEDGSKVEVVDDFKCAIAADRKDDAHNWIRKQGDGGIITAEVGVRFDKDEIELADDFAKQVKKITNKEVVVDESIHHSRLKSYLREKREKGQISGPIAKLFGIFPFVKAKVTPPSAKKVRKGQSGAPPA